MEDINRRTDIFPENLLLLLRFGFQESSSKKTDDIKRVNRARSHIDGVHRTKKHHGQSLEHYGLEKIYISELIIETIKIENPESVTLSCRVPEWKC